MAQHITQLELLAPAGSLQALKAAVSAGADAVYFGGSHFSARAYAGNLSREEVLEAIDFGHIHGRKMILAVNTLFKEKEIKEQLYEYLLPFYEQGLDAVIVQDFGVMQWIRQNFPDLAICASTQMTAANVTGVRFLADAGASRVVLARELSLGEIQEIHKDVSVELECFVHGALCYCYSGQCLFSSILGGRSGNRGRCAQPCRLPYEAYERSASLHRLSKISSRNCNYPLSPKDLCAISLIPGLAKSGVSSLKIEGRMKQAAYAAGVVSVYRKYIDRYYNYGEENYAVSKEDQRKLISLGSRSGFTEGYCRKQNGPDMMAFSKPGYEAQREQEVPKADCRENISGRIVIAKNKPIELTVSFGQMSRTVTGGIPKTAQNAPLQKETVSAWLNKTGNTPFQFEQLSIQLEEGLFLPASAVNELRRLALEGLEEQITRCFRRERPSRNETLKAVEQPIEKRFAQDLTAAVFTASAETKEQIAALLGSPLISGIYVDSTVFSREEMADGMNEILRKAEKLKKEIYWILPAVFRNSSLACYDSILPKIKADGFLAKSYDVLGFLLERGICRAHIRTDHNLYTWSKESREAFLTAGDTIPLELNRNEIRARDNRYSEMIVYGYLPLMVSAQCLQKNLKGCNCRRDILYLKDRRGVSFPVKNNCEECYNVLYNSRPLYLFPMLKELISFGIRSFRLSFTIESAAAVTRVLEQCKTASLGGVCMPEGDYTYGHYKRGVE